MYKLLYNIMLLSTAIALQLSGQRYDSHSLVILTDIGEGDTAALLCLTDREMCCRGSDGGAGGDWYYPDGGLVPFAFGGTSIYQTRGASRVRLNRRNDAQSPTGVYRCDVLDASGTNQSIYVGVYLEGRGTFFLHYHGIPNHTVSVITPGSPTVDSLTFAAESLTCSSSGGPATTVIWERNGVPLNVNGGAAYQQTQTVTNPVTADYQTILTSNNVSVFAGSFTCTVSNTRGSATETISIGENVAV